MKILDTMKDNQNYIELPKNHFQIAAIESKIQAQATLWLKLEQKLWPTTSSQRSSAKVPFAVHIRVDGKEYLKQQETWVTEKKNYVQGIIDKKDTATKGTWTDDFSQLLEVYKNMEMKIKDIQ